MSITIDQVWSSKEDSVRGNNWKNEEVIALLTLVKTNKLLRGYPSNSQLGHLVEPLMNYSRTAAQISSKLKNLRESFLRCNRLGCTPEARRQCPYYDLLYEMYGVKYSELYDASDFAEDVKPSSIEGTEKILAIIKDLKITADLSIPESFPHNVINLISKMLISQNVTGSPEHIRDILMNLKTMYINIRNCKSRGEICPPCVYYDDLHAIWGTIDIPATSTVQKIVPKTPINTKEFEQNVWSVKETNTLLTSIRRLKLTREAWANTAESARHLQNALNNSNFHRTLHEIQQRLGELKHKFFLVKQAKCPEDVNKMFPFFNLYNDIFGEYYNLYYSTDNEDKNITENGENLSQDDEMSLAERVRNVRNVWSNDETLSLLELLENLNKDHDMGNRLSLEVACQLMKPMSERGYKRSPIQIQIKLRGLRKNYNRCIETGCTWKSISECPFFDKLDAIFKKHRVGTKLGNLVPMEQVYRDYPGAKNSLSRNYDYGASRNKTLHIMPKIEHTDGAISDIKDFSFSPENLEYFDNTQNSAVRFDILEDNSNHDLSLFEKTESFLNIETQNDSVELEDPQDKCIASMETESVEIDHTSDNNYIDNINKVEVILEDVKPGPSFTSPLQDNFSRPYKASKRKLRRDKTAPNSRRSRKSSTIMRTMKFFMSQLLRHEKFMQRQHHIWMERHFEMQRKSDREHKDMLTKEFRELRKAIISIQSKQDIVNNKD